MNQQDQNQPDSSTPASQLSSGAPAPVESDDSSKNPAAAISKKNKDVAEIRLPQEAQDSDLIEKEWVDRAKDIVAHTSGDPHEQQRAINLMKAEYVKKRYNRDLKTDD